MVKEMILKGELALIMGIILIINFIFNCLRKVGKERDYKNGNIKIYK